MRPVFLAVDDSPTVLAFVTEVLSTLRVGPEILTATNGEEALRRARERSPDVIIMDWEMPAWVVRDLALRHGGDVDLTDVDLWVVEPNGEKCFYSNNRTRIGGRLSCDFTNGYGPEEYTLRQGIPGTYTIHANYYGSDQQTLTGPATILATIFTNFGRPDEQRRTITVRLSEVNDVVDVGEVALG